jgi:mono/diheme cytochrome c family protein
MTPASATYRPTGITVAPDGSLYLSEDNTGRIWKIEYTGETVAATSSSGKAVMTPTSNTVENEIAQDPKGHTLYNQYCMACHQIDGSGVPSIQPSLIGSAKLSDDTHLLKLMLLGSEWIEEREYNNVMTTFSFLSDSDIATILNYNKARFAKSPPTITSETVAQMRANLNQ